MSEDRVAVLLEDIDDKLQSLAEVVPVVQQDIAVMKPQVARIPEMAADIATIKAVQTDQGHEIHHVERYLTAQGMPQRA